MVNFCSDKGSWEIGIFVPGKLIASFPWTFKGEKSEGSVWFTGSRKKRNSTRSPQMARTGGSARNTLIDALAGLLSTATNEAISAVRSFLFSLLRVSDCSYPSLCRVSSMLTGHLTYTSHGCANAKYVGRYFLFAQRFSDTLPAFANVPPLRIHGVPLLAKCQQNTRGPVLRNFC